MRGFVARLRRYEWRQHVLTAEGGTSGRTRQVQMQAPVFMRVQAALLLSEIVAICSSWLLGLACFSDVALASARSA